MKKNLYAAYDLKEEIVEKIEKSLEKQLQKYDDNIIYNIVFCDISKKLDEQFLQKMFDNNTMIIRISESIYNPFVFTINDDYYDIYQNNFNDEKFIKSKRSNMDIFNIRIKKLLELQITPSFFDIPNNVNLVKIKDYLSRMVKYIEYINMTEINHSIRVAEYGKLLAKKINYQNPDLIYVAGLLHDVGKSFVSADIRLARRNLSSIEFEQMKQHSLYSYNLLNKELYYPVRDIILSHHERCDGSGYPNKIKNISLESKILAIVDSYDAMTSSRIYDVKIKSFRVALENLQNDAQKGLYDKELVNQWCDVIMEKETVTM